MKSRWLVSCVAAGFVATSRIAGRDAQTPREPSPRPGFHHIHMNSVHPSVAIAEFLAVYPAGTKLTLVHEPGK